jgi:flagellar hook-associated protein 3 FlgL
MKISTNQFFDRAVGQMSERQISLSTVQAQLAQGKKIIKPSDEPDRAGALLRIRSMVDRQDRHLDALVAAKNRLQSEEAVLKNSSNLIIRIKELALAASNDSYDASNREVIAIEIDGMTEQLLSLANARDTQENYLFSGARVKDQPFVKDSNGRIVYMGDETRFRIAVGDHRDINLNRSGTDVFGPLPRDTGDPDAKIPDSVSLFESLQDLTAGIRQGDHDAMNRGIGELDKMMNRLTFNISEVGTDLSVASMQTEVVEETQIQLKSVLSNEQDLDYAEAVARMQKQMLALEAAQRSFSQISQLNLFQYIS